MSRNEVTMLEDSTSRPPRKRKAESQELEIDVDAPEPPSKKAARKAKRKRSVSEPKVEDTEPTTDLTHKAAVSANAGRSQVGIWIGNLSFSTTQQELHEFLIGDVQHPVVAVEITRVHLPLSTARIGSKSQNKGFAYVDFSTPEAQRNALQLSEKLLGGRRVLIKSSKDFEGRPDKSRTEQHSSEKPPSKRVFIGNLGFDTTKEDLENHFQTCGTVTNIHMATFEDSGKCKGFAWIEFEEVASAAAAVRGWVESSTAEEVSQSKRSFKSRQWVNMIGGRKLRAEFAEDKTTRYNKRYGKDARTIAGDTPSGEEPGESVVTDGKKGEGNLNDVESISTKPQAEVATFNERIRKPRKSNRYDDETMKKLTGTIIDAQGVKTTFD